MKDQLRGYLQLLSATEFKKKEKFWFVSTKEGIKQSKNSSDNNRENLLLFKDVVSIQEVSDETQKPEDISEFWFRITTHDRAYYLGAENEQERTRWIDELRKILASENFTILV